MIKLYDPTKSQERLHGQYPITELNTNWTVKVQQDPMGTLKNLKTFKILKHTKDRWLFNMIRI